MRMTAKLLNDLEQTSVLFNFFVFVWFSIYYLFLFIYLFIRHLLCLHCILVVIVLVIPNTQTLQKRVLCSQYVLPLGAISDHYGIL